MNERRRIKRPQIFPLKAVGSAPETQPEIPASAGVEIHGGIDGWTEVEPGVWVNQVGTFAYHHLYKILDPTGWDMAEANQDLNGDWYAPATSYTPPAKTTTPPVNVEPPAVVHSPTVVAVDPHTEAETDSQPATAGGSWLWLLLLAIYLATRKDK